MKPNDAGEDMWLGAGTANEKLKQNAHKQDADGMHALSVLYGVGKKTSHPTTFCNKKWSEMALNIFFTIF